MAITTAAHQILEQCTDAETGEIPEAFWGLVDRYRVELVNQAFAIVRNLDDAEEVVQETLCEAYRHRERLARSPSLGTSLRTINRANALDRVRHLSRNANKVARKCQALPPRNATTGGISFMEMREALVSAIEKLPAKMRSVVVMRFWEHRSYEDIGECLDIPARTVCLIFHDATQRLYSIMEPQLDKRPSDSSNDEPTDEGREP